MKRIFLTTIFAVYALFTFGQESYWSATYQVSIPTGATQDMVGKTSFRGFGIEGRKFVDNNVALGGGMHWNAFYEKKDKITTEFDNITLTGTHYNYINSFPLLVNAAYYFNEGSYFRPYAGINTGVTYVLYRKDIGLYSIQDDPWKFTVAPEIGFLIQTYGGANFTINFRYNYGLETSSSDPLSYFGINAGFVWLY